MRDSAQQRLKKSAKHTAIYAVGTIIRRIAGFVMLPIYTRYLTPQDYGVIELLTVATQFISIIVGLRITQAMLRYYVLADTQYEKQRIVSTVLITALCMSALGVVLLSFGSAPISMILFGHKDYADAVQLFGFCLITNTVTATGLSYLRAQQKPVHFVTVGVCVLVLQIVSNLVFVVHLEMGVMGVIISALVSGAIVSLTLFTYIVTQVGFTYSSAFAYRLLRFVYPLVLSSLGGLYVAYADKYFVRVFCGLDNVGLYALASRLGSVVMIAYEGFNLSWAADRFEIYKRPDARELFSCVFRFLNVGLFLIGAFLIIGARDVLWLMADPAFYPAAAFVTPLVLATIMRVYNNFCNFGLYLSESTKDVAIGSFIKAVLATIGCLTLIPSFGPMGAGYALLLSGFSEFLWVNHRATKHYDMQIDWWFLLPLASLVGLAVILAELLPFGDFRYTTGRIMLCATLPVLVWMLPVLKPQDRALLAGLLRKKARLDHQ